MKEPMWVNYHKHTSLSNVYTKDSPLVHKDYWNELNKRYGNQECIYTTVEHGWAGNYFKTYDTKLCIQILTLVKADLKALESIK